MLGVLIALGLGVVATAISQRSDVGDARDALAFEIGETVGQARERVNFGPCIERRLDEVTAIVDAAEKSGRLPPVGKLSTAPWRTWDRGVWDSTIASQTAFHFPRAEANGLTALYRFVDLLNDSNRRELDVWSRLYSLVGPGRAFSPAEAERTRETIIEARTLHRFITLSGIRADQIATAYRLKVDAGEVRDYAENPVAKLAICQPIPRDAPPTYGQAPWEDIVATARAHPITVSSGGVR
ncbi:MULTISPECIES: hypothetical protein [Sphingomonas]|uniref:hypothetical protein n=1 Tax=Sphingomonas TaxID=13687 RepID=UPI001269B378|nr:MULTISPECIES: hypothetical protein [Sphingomonas]